MNKTVKGD